MHTNFLKYIQNKISDTDKYDELLSNIKDLDNLTVKELVLISNTINEPYTRIVNMYTGEGEYLYTYSKVKELVESKDVNGLKRLILDGGIILHNDTVNIKYRLNEHKPFILKESIYQEMLRLLIESNEIKLAQMISNKHLVYNDLSLNTKNVIAYLYNESDGYPIQYVYHNYSKLPSNIKEVLEPKMVASYLEAIKIINSNQYEVTVQNPFLDLDFTDTHIKFKLNSLYLEFSEDSRNIILNAMKGNN